LRRTEPRLSLLLRLGDSSAFGRGATTKDTIAYGAKMLQRYPVDWAAADISEDDLNGLAEVIMRLLTSLLQHPAQLPQDEAHLRALLNRWLAPALLQPSVPARRPRLRVLSGTGSGDAFLSSI